MSLSWAEVEYATVLFARTQDVANVVVMILNTRPGYGRMTWSGIDATVVVAKGSEQARWEWSGGIKKCAGCERTLTLKDVACWHSQAGAPRVIFCEGCYPERWREWIANGGSKTPSR